MSITSAESAPRANDPLGVTAAREADQQSVGSAGDTRSSPPDALTTSPAGRERERSSSEQTAGLSEQERLQVRELAQRDAEVRAHEAAHAAAGGAITGSPTYSFARGPDGRMYATGGEVSVDTRPVAGDPEATIEKARTIISAATAPAEPSAQDLRAAAQAQAMLVEAQAELNRQEASQSDEETESEVESEPQAATEEAAEAAEVAESRDPLREARDAADRREEINREAQDRLERTRDAQKAFADQLEDLNRNLAKIQQQLIDSGAVSPSQAIGSILDTSA